MAVLGRVLSAAIVGTLSLSAATQSARSADVATEYQVKAVFIYNFSHFVEWPSQAFATPNEPFDICVFGNDPFGSHLDEAVRGEEINQHPLLVLRIRSVAEASGCRILYIGRSEEAELHEVLSALDHRGVLTVSEQDGSAERGVMIQFTMENKRIRLRINVDSARSAGLTISSNLLRPAEIVATTGKD